MNVDSFASATVRALYQLDAVRSAVASHTPHTSSSAAPCAACALATSFAWLAAERPGAGGGGAATVMTMMGKVLQDASLTPAADVAALLRAAANGAVSMESRAVRTRCGALVRGSARLDSMLFAYAASLRRAQRRAAALSVAQQPRAHYESASAALWGHAAAAAPGPTLSLSRALAQVSSEAHAWPACGACEQAGAMCGVQRQFVQLPAVFTVGFLWEQRSAPSLDELTAALWLVDDELVLDDVFPCAPTLGPPPPPYALSGMLCQFGTRFVAFFKRDGAWLMFADARTTLCGEFNAVFELCRRERLQPFVLFYEPRRFVQCDMCHAALAPADAVLLNGRDSDDTMCGACMTTAARSLGADVLARTTSVRAGALLLTRARNREPLACSRCLRLTKTAFVDADASSWLCADCTLARVVASVDDSASAATPARQQQPPAQAERYLHLPSRPADDVSPRESSEVPRERRARSGTGENPYGDLPRPAPIAVYPVPVWWRDDASGQHLGLCTECNAELAFSPNAHSQVPVACAVCQSFTIFPAILPTDQPPPSFVARPLPLAPHSSNTCVVCGAPLTSPADDPMAAEGACAVCEWRRDLARVLEDDVLDTHAAEPPSSVLPNNTYAALATVQPPRQAGTPARVTRTAYYNLPEPGRNQYRNLEGTLLPESSDATEFIQELATLLNRF